MLESWNGTRNIFFENYRLVERKKTCKRLRDGVLKTKNLNSELLPNFNAQLVDSHATTLSIFDLVFCLRRHCGPKRYVVTCKCHG
jgi:hypothetical protein